MKSSIPALAILLTLAACDFSNGQMRVGDTPSHRRIPLASSGELPRLESLLNHPELRAMEQEYRRLRRERIQVLRSNRSERLPGESRSELVERFDMQWPLDDAKLNT